MLLSLLMLFLFEGMMLWSTFNYQNTGNMQFNQVMSIWMSVVYGIIPIIYIPLFTTILQRLKTALPSLHAAVHKKATAVFVFFMLLIAFRYFVYFSLQFANFGFLNISKLTSLIPFYVSELIISVAYIRFLIKVFRNQTIEVRAASESGQEVMVDMDVEQGNSVLFE